MNPEFNECDILREYHQIFESKLVESKSSLIICDVQPHDMGKYIHWDEYKFAEFVNKYRKVLVLFNGDEFGWESQADMEDVYLEWGIDVGKCEFYDKGYAWFRGLMDSGYDIEQLISYMLKHRVDDSRDIEDQTLMKLLDSDEVPADPLYIPEVSDVLSNWRNSDIVGGGRNECLAEVKLLLDGKKLRYKEISQWVYG